ncbi:MAG TPA: hypothetical protein VJT68_05305 [Thermoleophilaceae bacterium]|nr:hypothetical protein [Thermoleophilaceae bacterium]
MIAVLALLAAVVIAGFVAERLLGDLRGVDERGARGDADPFRPEIDAFTGALRAAGVEVSAHTWPGGHDGDYWDEHWPAYARFYARALAHC